jgi:hypothetical protein
MAPESPQDEDGGRRSGAEELARRLPGASRCYLAGALENPALTTRHLLVLLRNRAADEEIIQRIASRPAWMSSYLVKRAIVCHPHAPHALGLNLVKFLFWKDLLAVTQEPVLHPPLRRAAEQMLGEKLGEMALGEKITLARIAGRGLVGRLLEETQPKVLEAALWNGRVTSSARAAGRRRDPRSSRRSGGIRDGIRVVISAWPSCETPGRRPP